MTRKKLVASHYTVAQVTRLLGVNYNRIRAIMNRVPGCQVEIVGTQMIPAEKINALRLAKAAIDRERAV